MTNQENQFIICLKCGKYKKDYAKSDIFGDVYREYYSCGLNYQLITEKQLKEMAIICNGNKDN